MKKASIPFLSLILFLFLFLFLFQSIPPPPQAYSTQITTNSSTTTTTMNTTTTTKKRLRRLPHVFSKVLQLPFSSDADVAVEETHDCFRFVAETRDLYDDVRALAVEIHPGVTKVVVRNGDGVVDLSLTEMEVDVWRFRLPESTVPCSATAVFADGRLVVTVPKRRDFAAVEALAGVGHRLVLVQ